MAAILVWLECITNMHVGNGDINYNIIDNEVERDPVNHYPTINSSGVKGALREYFEKNQKEYVREIFGADKEKDMQMGKLKFLSADMVAIPFRASKGERAYYLVTTKTALERFEEINRVFLKKDLTVATENVNNIAVEGKEITEKITLNGKEIYLMRDDLFRRMSLPVLARNKLENGKSKNLWYEEVVPHKSIFAFMVLADDSDRELLDVFKENIHEKVLQFGGNASIGYGLCKATVMEG